jgi:hypothetical protein
LDRWDGVGFSVTQVEPGGFFASERARASAAEDGDLITAFGNPTWRARPMVLGSPARLKLANVLNILAIGTSGLARN